MKKKSVWSGILAISLALMLLAGCSPESTGEAKAGKAPTKSTSGNTEPPVYTMEDIHTKFRLTEILKQMDCVGYQEEWYWEDAAEPIWKIEAQFRNTEDGIQMDMRACTEDGIFYEQGRISKDFPGATYGIGTMGDKTITVYPEGRYEAKLEYEWLLGANSERESLVDCVVENGIVIVSTRTDYSEDFGGYDTTTYYIEQETGRLTYWERTGYNDDNSLYDMNKVTIIYDDTPIVMEKDPYNEIISEQDYCEVSVIYDYMTDKPNVQWFPVSDGTTVSVEDDKTDGTSYALYSDTDMTKAFEDDVAVAGEVMNVFGVSE